MEAGAFVLMVTAVFVGVLGGLIRFGGAVELVAGYDPERVSDEAGLARFVGTNTLYIAAATLVLGVVEYGGVMEGASWYWTGYVVVVVAIVVRLLVGSRRFEGSPTDADES
jgi:hypothetical protein